MEELLGGLARLDAEMIRSDKALLDLCGSGGRDRTYDQLINSQLLYR